MADDFDLDLDPFGDLTPEEKDAKIKSAQDKLQKVLGFNDEKFSGFLAANDTAFHVLGIMTTNGLLMPEQGMAFVAILADVQMGRTAPSGAAQAADAGTVLQ